VDLGLGGMPTGVADVNEVPVNTADPPVPVQHALTDRDNSPDLLLAGDDPVAAAEWLPVL
jgi:hypothetical protein